MHVTVIVGMATVCGIHDIVRTSGIQVERKMTPLWSEKIKSFIAPQCNLRSITMVRLRQQSDCKPVMVDYLKSHSWRFCEGRALCVRVRLYAHLYCLASWIVKVTMGGSVYVSVNVAYYTSITCRITGACIRYIFDPPCRSVFSHTQSPTLAESP